MASIWDSIKETAESIGGALVAPPGAVVDLAQMALDDKDDNFGSAMAAISKRGGDMLNPFTNPETLTGAAFSKTMEAANWALWNGISEPISTLTLASQHASQQDSVGERFRTLFDGDTWSRAYSLAQETSAGEAFSFGLLDSETDPFAFDDPYNEVTAKEHTILGPGIKWTANVLGTWYLDPLVVGGKAASALRSANHFHKMSAAEKATLYSRVTEGSRSGLLKQSPKTRTDDYLTWIGGQNSLKRPLEAPEILHGTPELRKYAAEPHVIAGLLADANKLTDDAARRNTQRRILAVAAGDTSQIARLRTEMKESASIADALTNMVRDSTLDLKMLAAAPTLRHDPAFVAHLEGQLANLNKGGDVDRFIDGWNSRLNQILETQQTMPMLPGVHAAGKRAVNRLNDTGALRAPKHAAERMDEWAAKRASRAQSASSLFQKGRHTVPVVTVKTVGLMASPYTKAPIVASDALRQAHFTGIANLHDWGGAATQLDSMMRLSKVSPGERMKALSEAYLAKSEPEKMRVIDRIEALSMKSMAREFGEKYGREIDRDYIETLMGAHAAKRGMSLTQLRGRAYAATEMPADMAGRMGSAQRADDAARWTQSAGFSSKPQGKWRVDQIDDNGTPLSLPLIETQLGNSVPLLDMGMARKLLERDNSYLARLSRSWKDESLELKRLSEAKARGAQNLDKAIAAKSASLDWLVNAGQMTMRAWKFSVLFRLGYPMRVVMDDHWRIWTQMSALSFYGGNGREMAANLKYNVWERGHTAKAEVHALRVRRQEILDELDGDIMAVHLDRQADVKRLRRELGAQKGQLTKASRHAAQSRADGVTIHVEDNAAWARHPEHGPIAEMKWNPATGEIENVGVLPEFRRQGIATDMLKATRAKGVTINHSPARTNEGDAWAKAQDGRDLPARQTVAQGFDGYDQGVTDGLRKSLAVHVAKHERLAAHEAAIADKEAAISFKLEELGDYGPDDLKRELSAIEDEIRAGSRARKADKRTIGSADIKLGEGSIPGAFGDLRGAASYEAARSSDTFETQLRGVEERMFQTGMRGSHRTIQPQEPGHLDAWADALNYQIRQSPVAMHFVKGGDLGDFVRWVKQPEQAQLRERLSHFAHDPEDWGGRVQALIHDYIPTDALREAVLGGRVSARQLGKMFSDQSIRPAVHGRSLADNIGNSHRTLGVSKAMNRIYKMLGEMPTDNLSRHPFFNSVYKRHAQEAYEIKRAGFAAEGKKFTQADFDDIERVARKRALHDLKRTLFDISAHSHAAHVMRFVSPFFAAHQESIARWWRIVGDDPSVVRRFALGFDLPRHLGLVVDEDGNMVKPGDSISREHRLLLQLPKEFGGPDTDPNNPDSKWSNWSISENSFNLVLQGGLTNPGVGPIVSVPVEYLARKYANEPEIARVARVFNPFPPQSPMEAALPATFKRVSAYTYGKTGFDPSFGLGIGMREYNDAYSQTVQDTITKFQLDNGREPNRAETQELMLQAGRETNTLMFHRILWNSLSPAPASPRSKYAIIQQGWYKIAEQARAEDRDFDWAYSQFKEKYGAAYMPLVYSSANNPAHLEATPGTVAALKRYKGVLDRIDPSLTRMVVGAYADDLTEENLSMGEFSPEARAFLRTKQMKPGSPDTYYSYDDPRTAVEEQMARRGWQQYGELTGALTAQAQALGLSSYRESPALTALKSAGVAKLRAENFAFDRAYGEFDSTEYDRYIDDMRTIVKSPVLAGDTERTDVQVLAAYLRLRDTFVNILNQRDEAGFGGPDAQANQGIRAAYTALVGQLVESNTYFETHMFNGVVERDPLLVGD